MHGRAITRWQRRAANDPRNGAVTDVRQLSHHSAAHDVRRVALPVSYPAWFAMRTGSPSPRQQLLLTCHGQFRIIAGTISTVPMAYYKNKKVINK